MIPRSNRWTSIYALGIGLFGLTGSVAFTSAQLAVEPRLSDLIALGVPGQVNSAVQLASMGETVAAVWGARAPGATAGDIMLALSRDAGRTFAQPRQVTVLSADADVGGEQPPSVVFRTSEELYVVWRSVQGSQNAIVAAHSDDAGQSFSPPQPLHETSQPAFRGFQSAAVGPDGTLYVTWLDGRHADGRKRQPHAAPRQDVYHAAWKPGYQPREVQLQDDVCFCCKTATGVSSNGAISVAWRHLYPDSVRDVAFVRQTDGSFRPPARVSEDHWELAGCPDDGPSLAIDSGGSAHLVWPTVVQHTSPAKTVFYARSTDGQEFSKRLAVPRLGGDTMSHPRLTLDDRERPVVVWEERHDGARRIGLTYLPARGAGVFRAAISLDAIGRAQYPAVAPVPGAVVVAWTSGSELDGSTVAMRRVALPSD